MGMDWAIFLSKEQVGKTKKIIKDNGFDILEAGFIKRGERKVLIKPKNIVFRSKSLEVKSC